MPNPYRDAEVIKPQYRPPFSSKKAFAIGIKAALALENPLKKIAIDGLDSNELPNPADRVAYLGRIGTPAVHAALKKIRKSQKEIAQGMRAVRQPENSHLEEQLYNALLKMSWERAEMEDWFQIIKSGNMGAGGTSISAYRNWGEDDVAAVLCDSRASSLYQRLLKKTMNSLFEANSLIISVCSRRDGLSGRLRDITEALAEASERSQADIETWLTDIKSMGSLTKPSLSKAVEIPTDKGSLKIARASMRALQRVEREIAAGNPESFMAKTVPVEDRIIYALDRASRCVGDIRKEAEKDPHDERLKLLLRGARLLLYQICDEHQGRMWTKEGGTYARQIRDDVQQDLLRALDKKQ